MYILSNKRRTAALVASFVIVGFVGYQYRHFNADNRRVQSVIFNDQNIYHEYGEIADYQIKNRISSLNDDQLQLYHYDLAVVGHKKSGEIVLDMQQIPEQEGYRYSIQ
jgi:hypothetical protein